MTFFSSTNEAPSDPIFQINAQFLADPREDKINLGIGSYKNAELEPYILPTVKKVEARFIQEEKSKDYLPIDGDQEFCQLYGEVIFGASSPLFKEKRVYMAQTVGGTGGLALAADILLQREVSQVYIPRPTWDNHHRLFAEAGFKVKHYPYYDPQRGGVDFEGLCLEVEKAPLRSAFLFQGPCHNPTGCDLTHEQWRVLCLLLQQRELFPIFDFAYQGFGEGVEEDSFPIRLFAQEIEELIVVGSCSKNFTLYAERCGALFVLCADAKVAKKIGSHIKITIRSLYSNPPCHGARIVKAILKEPALKNAWMEELKEMRNRIGEMRQLFVERLERADPTRDYSSIKKQRGMFSYTDLTEAQVERLIAEYGIYPLKDGRVNVAGLNLSNLDRVVQAIVEVKEHARQDAQEKL